MKEVSDLLENKKLDSALFNLKAICHPLRIKLIRFIDKEKSVNVNKIYSRLKIEQSMCSQQLKILRGAGVVLTNRKGKFIFYSIDHNRLEFFHRQVELLFNKVG